MYMCIYIHMHVVLSWTRDVIACLHDCESCCAGDGDSVDPAHWNPFDLVASRNKVGGSQTNRKNKLCDAKAMS